MGKTIKSTANAAPALNVQITTGSSTINNGPIPQPTAANTFGFTDAASKFIRPVSLSEAGKKYIDTLVEKFAALPAAVGLRIKVKTVPNLVEIRAIIDEVTSTYVILYFNESYTGNGMEPVVNMTPEVVKIMEGIDPNVKLIQTIVVTADDYDRVEQMAAHLINCFTAKKLGDQINANVFRAMSLSPDTDLRAVKNFIDRRSPHGTPDRIDWGVLLRREVRQNPIDGYTMEHQIVREPVLAIGGYTKFLRISNSLNGDKIFPICVITNITSDIPCQNILALALPVAASAAISHEMWKRPFKTIAKDKPNLGHLVRDLSKNVLKYFNTEQEMQEEIARSFYYPQLALDIPEGRAHIVGLENYYQNNQLFDLTARNFFGTATVKDANGKDVTVEVWPSCPKTVSAAYINFEGSVIFEGRKEDTRTCDYLNFVNSMKSTNLQVEQFLQQYPNTDVRLKNIAAILGTDTVSPTYRAYTVLLDSPFINQLAYYLQNVIRYAGEVNVNCEMNIAALLEAQGVNGMIQGNNAIYGNYAQVVMPVNLYV